MLDLVLGPSLTLHRPLVNLLQPLLEVVESRRVLVEDPLEQGGDERRPVQLPGRPGAGRELGELVQHGDRPFVGCHHPVVGDQALDLRQLVGAVSVRRVDGQMHVPAGVAEARRPRRRRKASPRVVVEVERTHHGTSGVLGWLGDVDPQELRAAQALRQVVDAREALGAMTVEQEDGGPPIVRRERGTIASLSPDRGFPRRADHARVVYPFALCFHALRR